jgi:uncharacterized lipoprotein NlpE involved in copper resistance
MQKLNFFWLETILFFLVACAGPTSEETASDNIQEQEEIIDMHNARIALDYTGSYSGILPCADCEGIVTEVILVDESQFIRRIQYLGHDDMVFEESGIYSWDESGNTITLEGADEPNRYFVSENRIFHLDMDGNRIEGELANMYILEKN